MTLPIELYPYQLSNVEDLKNLPRMGIYNAPGTGKTWVALGIAEWKRKQEHIKTVLVVVPPILIDNWRRYVETIEGVTVEAYKGTPSKRAEIEITEPDYLIVGVQVFKKDFHRFEKELSTDCFVIVDEAQCLKNPASDNFKKVKAFATERRLALLTGTPVSSPLDAYAMIKLVSPEIYKTQHVFEFQHVADRDFFGKPKKWVNLEVLQERLMKNSVRVLTEDVLKDLPEVTYDPLFYDLDPRHLRLYETLAEEQVAKLDGGGKKDLTNVSALFQALNQIPANAEHFSSGSVESTVIELIKEVLDEIGGRKLVVFTHYVMSTERVAALLEKLGISYAMVYGKTKDRQAEIDRFVEDPQCKVFIGNIAASGVGVDRLQHVCRDALFIEVPYRSSLFRQAVARLHRDGQRNAVHIRVAVANKTLQPAIWKSLQQNDDLVAQCIRSPETLHNLLHGR
jgi:SNF2 family DNA or RNA helicase